MAAGTRLASDVRESQHVFQGSLMSEEDPSVC